MPVKKYLFDSSSLEYREFKLTGSKLAVRLITGFFVSVVLAAFYFLLIGNWLGSPKSNLLSRELEVRKVEFELMQESITGYLEKLEEMRLSDEVRYRPVLELEPISDMQREVGIGGVRRSADLEGYLNSNLMIGTAEMLQNLKRRAAVQSRSFEEISIASGEWNAMLEHLPRITPVKGSYRLGDAFGIRARHPVTGMRSVLHRGQDFRTPTGTNIYATGAGIVTEAGWNAFGYGYYVRIDHGYGYETLYAHLSKVLAEQGQKVVRGELIGLSGDTGQSTGPHLHYEVIIAGRHDDPRNHFNNVLTDEEYRLMVITRSVTNSWGAQ